MQIIPIAIVGALFSLISEAAAKNPERLRRFVGSAWEILLGLAFPIVAIGMVLAHPLAGLLFGGEFEGPTGTVLILIWPVVIAIFLGYLGGLVPAVNLVRAWTFIAFGGAFLCVALCLLLIPPFGANGAAIATVATEYPVMIATLWITCRRAHLHLPLGRVVRMVAAAAAAGGLAYLGGRISLFLGIAAGGVVYVLLLQVTRVVDVPVLLRAIRRPRDIARSLG